MSAENGYRKREMIINDDESGYILIFLEIILA